jgi:osmotically-inducible protein OsmY
MKLYAPLLILAAAAGACDKGNATSTDTITSGTTAPDNTKTNTRDKAGAAITPIDQGNDRASLDTTQAIRKAVMADDSLSGNAKNVKIITNNGVITLRGPVASDVEKKSIEAKAVAAAGSNRVDDQIDIEATH